MWVCYCDGLTFGSATMLSVSVNHWKDSLKKNGQVHAFWAFLDMFLVTVDILENDPNGTAECVTVHFICGFGCCWITMWTGYIVFFRPVSKKERRGFSITSAVPRGQKQLATVVCPLKLKSTTFSILKMHLKCTFSDKVGLAVHETGLLTTVSTYGTELLKFK